MTLFAEYLSDRVSQLVQEGESGDVIMERLCASTGLDQEAIGGILDGSDPADLDEAALCARALDLDEVEALEVAGEGQLLSRWFGGDGDLGQVFAPEVRGNQDRVMGQSEFIASTGAEARDGDIIDQASWRLGHYSRNPVVLWNHDARTVVGTAKSRVVPHERLGLHLRSDVAWDVADDNPEGQRAAGQHFRRVRRGISVAWIAGKRVRRNELPEDDPRHTTKARKILTPFGSMERMGVVHFNARLVEQSSVSVPSDPRALQVRGLGHVAGATLRGLDHTDAPAVDDLREVLRSLVVDPELWADDALTKALAAPVRSLVRSNPGVRAALRGLLASAMVPGAAAPSSPDEEIGASYLDYLTMES